MPDSHGMQPVDEATGPFGPGELQPPKRPRLAHHASSLVDDQTAKKRQRLKVSLSI